MGQLPQGQKAGGPGESLLLAAKLPLGGRFFFSKVLLSVFQAVLAVMVAALQAVALFPSPGEGVETPSRSPPVSPHE